MRMNANTLLTVGAIVTVAYLVFRKPPTAAQPPVAPGQFLQGKKRKKRGLGGFTKALRRIGKTALSQATGGLSTAYTGDYSGAAFTAQHSNTGAPLFMGDDDDE